MLVIFSLGGLCFVEVILVEEFRLGLLTVAMAEQLEYDRVTTPLFFIM